MVRRVTSLGSQNYRRQCLIGPEKDGQAGHQLGLPELQKAVFDRTREGWSGGSPACLARTTEGSV